MALSGSVSTGKYDGRYYTLEWTATQSIENNTSSVKWTLKAVGGNHDWYAERTLKVVLGGSTVYSKTTRVSRYRGTVASGTTLISHNSNGDASFTVSIQAAVYYSAVNCTGSKTFTLDNIPRKSTLAASNGTLGTIQTLTVTRISNNFTHTITYKCGTATGTIVTKSSSTSISFTPPLSLASQNTSGTNVSITFTIETFNGNTSIGTNTKTITCSIPASVKPSCTLTVKDATGYFDKYGVYLKGYSKLSVTVTPKTANGSDIASYSVKVNGVTYTKANFTTGVLTSTGALTVSATVTDNRGRIGTTNATYEVVDYSQPQITDLKVKRCNEDGTENILGEYAQVIFSANVTALNNKNSATYKLEYKKQSETSYTAVVFNSYADDYSVKDISYIFEADSGSTYNVRLIVADDMASITKPTVLSTGAVIMHLRPDGKGLGLGKIGEIENGLDVGYVIRPNEGFINITLAENTDLNDVTKPNTYVSIDKNAKTYKNCPVASGTFSLEVASGGDEGQIVQTITYTSQVDFRIWKRFKHSGTWGEWQQIYTQAGNVLWDGAEVDADTRGLYMNADHTATLKQKVSEQPHGITLVFSLFSLDEYQARNEQMVEHQILKKSVSLFKGNGFAIPIFTPWQNAIKYLYIHDDKIVGNNKNSQDFTVGGISYSNARFVLRYVIGW